VNMGQLSLGGKPSTRHFCFPHYCYCVSSCRLCGNPLNERPSLNSVDFGPFPAIIDPAKPANLHAPAETRRSNSLLRGRPRLNTFQSRRAQW
jgi:hypothetical protein